MRLRQNTAKPTQRKHHMLMAVAAVAAFEKD